MEYAKSFFPIMLLVFGLRSFLVEPFQIPSSSMRPGLVVGDFILVNKFAYGVRTPIINNVLIPVGQVQHGDVVVFGSTLGFDCGAGLPAPAGSTASCGGQINIADGAPDLWWRDDIADASITATQARTSATLTLTSVTLLDIGNYDVVVSNTVNPSATSTPVALAVTMPAPGPQLNYAGGTYSQNFDGLPATGTFTFTGPDRKSVV